jgi:hypothetical protein
LNGRLLLNSFLENLNTSILSICSHHFPEFKTPSKSKIKFNCKQLSKDHQTKRNPSTMYLGSRVTALQYSCSLFAQDSSHLHYIQLKKAWRRKGQVYITVYGQSGLSLLEFVRPTEYPSRKLIFHMWTCSITQADRLFFYVNILVVHFWKLWFVSLANMRDIHSMVWSLTSRHQIDIISYLYFCENYWMHRWVKCPRRYWTNKLKAP